MVTIEDLNLSKKYNIKELKRSLYFLPPVFRCIVNGSSGCGKTNLLIQLLYKIMEKEKHIRFQLCSKTIDQPLYRGFINDIRTNFPEHIIELSEEISHFDEEYFKSTMPTHKEIIIIDDMLGVMNKKDVKKLVHLFSASRPRGISIFFLTQRYTKLDVVCRRNSNYLITFKPSLDEAEKMCHELINDMMDMEQLLTQFKDKPFYALFFDLEKIKYYTINDIFNIGKTEVYVGIDDLVERLILLRGEYFAGNDSENIANEMQRLTKILEQNLIFI